MKREKRPKYLWVCMTDEEIFAYSPVFYVNLSDAIYALHQDIHDIAEKNHYKPNEVMLFSENALIDRVREMWEGWQDVNEETEI